MNKLRAQERWGDLRRLQDDGPSGITKAFAGLTKAFALTQPTNSPLPFGFASAAVALQNPFSAAAIASPRCNAAASMLNTVLPERAPLKGVTMTFHAIAKTTDFQAELEPEGLIASHPRLRPANVLTGAFHQGHLAWCDLPHGREPASTVWSPWTQACCHCRTPARAFRRRDRVPAFRCHLLGAGFTQRSQNAATLPRLRSHWDLEAKRRECQVPARGHFPCTRHELAKGACTLCLRAQLSSKALS